jgi:NADH-quinone oxidoreductase subunit G
MIKSSGIDFLRLPNEDADDPLGIYTGAGTIFGATGGVMEAALRTAHHLVTGKEIPKIELTDIRGLEGVKAATLNIGETDVRVAVAHQMGNIESVLEEVRSAIKAGKEPPYHFIEVMACRGGCIGGGGQPYGATDEIRKKRLAGMYKDDEFARERCSHHNLAVRKLYDEYLGQPLSEKSHELLHTHYTARPLYSR